MVEHLLPSFAQAFLVSLIGAGAGFQYALRIAASAPRPSRFWQTQTILLAGVCGAILATIFQMYLEISYPLAPAAQAFMIQFLLGFAVAKFLTKRFLKRNP